MREDYLFELEELRETLGWLLRKDFLEELVALKELLNRSYTSRYKDLCEASEHGTDCGIAQQAKNLFLKFQEKGISEKIAHIYKLYIEKLK